MKFEGSFKYYKDMAQHIKNGLDNEFGGSWHIIVGTHFGSFFTYEVKCVTQFWIEHLGFLIFKHG
jgi:dynein light chain LC8-type